VFVDLTAIKNMIRHLVEEHKGEFTAIAAALYHSPETGLREYKSAALLSGILEREGFILERGIAGMETAFRAAYGGHGPVIAILAEMDALPEKGHACGHNVIAAAATGAAVVLRHALPAGAAQIVVLGTPAEEQGIGKCELIKAGFFNEIDFAMMVHPSSKRQVVKMYLGLAKVHFTFFGKAAHAAAYPEEGVNALDGVILTFNGVNALRQQVRQDVRVHGIITHGGIAPNIIPEKAACSFYVRADDLAEVAQMKQRVIACAQGAALAAGCRLQVDEDERVLAPLKVNRAFSALYSRQLAYLGLPESTAPADKNKGSSDIGNVSQVVPTIHPHVPIGDGVHIHSDDFARATISAEGQAAVLEGATALALTAAELAASDEVRETIRQEFASV
jgi:amidohydrolase